MALKLGIQTYQILTNEDEVGIPSLSSILLSVTHSECTFVYNPVALQKYEIHKTFTKVCS